MRNRLLPGRRLQTTAGVRRRADERAAWGLDHGPCQAQDAEEVLRSPPPPVFRAEGPDRKQEPRSVMRFAKILVPLAAIVTLTLTWSTPASAATINVSPSTVAVGGQVT